MEPETHTPPPAMDGLMSRRRLLQSMAIAGAGAFVAACGTAGTATQAPATQPPATTGGATTGPTTGPTAGPTSAPATEAASQAPPTSGTIKVASWLGYIDIGCNGSCHPSLDRFKAETGITVDYREDVDDNEAFYATHLAGPLERNQPTGWDIVILTDWMIKRLVDKGWLESITPGPNFPVNLGDAYTQRDWDPGNKFAAPWQSGMTGLGFDKNKTGELTDLGAFYDEKFAGKVTYQTEMNDCVGLTALYQGNDPTTLTQAQFDQAIAAITKAVNDGLVRQLTGNSYVNDLQNGDVDLAMAWSGDIQTTLVPEQTADQDFQWVLATQGGMLWTDNMAMPKGTPNKAQCDVFIQWYYDPPNAAEIEASVNYVCPVKGADKEIVKIEPALATNTLIFPSPEMVARLHEFKSQDQVERAEWEDSFAKAIGL